MRIITFLLAMATLLAAPARADDARTFDEIREAARGQTVYWNAWGGDEATNRFIAWVGAQVEQRYGVRVEHVKLADTAQAVTRVVAEKSAGRDEGGTIDLIWINGPNFLAMKQQDLLYGPFTDKLPNFAFVDTRDKPSNLVDFTTPVEGYASPWKLAQLVFLYDEALTSEEGLPRSMAEMLAWARANPGRLTHPSVRNFLGATFLKQALHELAQDPGVLQMPATDENFAPVTAPLWAWYDALRPNLWRSGEDFPESGPAQIQLLADGAIEIAMSFNPAAAAAGAASGILPASARVFTMREGTIGNTSFVAIPYNAANKEGAMVVADFLLDPEVQARAQDPTELGAFTVLDLDTLSPEQRAAFEKLSADPALPTDAELGRVLLEPHASWMTRLTQEWERRYVR